MRLSQEQEAVVNAVKEENCNVGVTAFAGCGKTTTILSACEYFVAQNRRCLVLTYNTALKDDNRRKVQERSWSASRDCEVHSFHSLALKYYGRALGRSYSRVDDVFIQDAVSDRQASSQIFSGPYPNPNFEFGCEDHFDFICIDEMQDMTPLLFNLLRDFILSMQATFPQKNNPQLLIVGDPFQMLYAHRNAKIGYFVSPEPHFKDVTRHNDNFVSKWKMLRLTISFRITHEMAQWINEKLCPMKLEVANPEWYAKRRSIIETAWQDGIRACPSRSACPGSVEFITRNWTDLPLLAQQYRSLCDTYGLTHSILLASALKTSNNAASSVRRKPIQELIQLLDDRQWVRSSDSKEDGDTRGEDRNMFQPDKYSVSTIHAFKGMECDAVCVFGLDSFQEAFPDNLQDPIRLFNTFYVACTRAKHKLLVVQFGVTPYVTIGGNKNFTSTFGNSHAVTSLLEHVGADMILDHKGVPGSIDSYEIHSKCPEVHFTERIENVSRSDSVRQMLDAAGSGSGLRLQTWGLVGSAIETELAFRLGCCGGETYMSPKQLLAITNTLEYEKESLQATAGKHQVAKQNEASFKSYCQRVASGEEDIHGNWRNLVRYMLAINCVQSRNMQTWGMHTDLGRATDVVPACRWVVPAVMDALLASAIDGIHIVARDLVNHVSTFSASCRSLLTEEDAKLGSTPALDVIESAPESNITLSDISRSQLKYVLDECYVDAQVHVAHPAITSLDDNPIKWICCVQGQADFELKVKNGGSKIAAVVELKVTRQQDHTHLLQAATYAAMMTLSSVDRAFLVYVINAFHGITSAVVSVPDPLMVPPTSLSPPNQYYTWFPKQSFHSHLQSRALILRLIARKNTIDDISLDEVRRVVHLMEDPAVVINGRDREGKPFPILSSDQQCVVDTMCRGGKNCRVNAVAGSGKTTTILAVVRRFVEKNKRCLVLTYNAALKEEIRNKVSCRGWEHLCEVHSYHALAINGYHGVQTSKNEKEFDAWIDRASSCEIKQPISPYELVAIDEVQDMKESFYQLVRDYVTRCTMGANNGNVAPQFLLVGDPFQQIYRYKGAILDYLINPEAHFSFARPSGWDLNIKLSISYRISHEMAAFVNESLNPTQIRLVYPQWYEEHGGWIEAAWGEGLKADPRRGPCPGSVIQIAGFANQDQRAALEEVFTTHLTSSMLISSSTKGSNRSPFGLFVAKSETFARPWHVVSSKEDQDPSLRIGKRLATTIHSVKGLECDGVVLSGFDGYFETFSAKKAGHHFNPLDIFNLYYVGVTRAKEKLAVFSHNALPFLTCRTRSCPHRAVHE